MNTATHWIVGILTLLGTLLAPTALAQEGDAGRFLKGRHDQVERLMRRSRPNRAEQISNIIGELLDYDALARASLAQQWEERSPAERRQFVGLLRQLIERNYRGNLESTQSYRIRYGSEDAQGETVLVHTLVRSRRNRRAPEVAIDYRMRQVGNRWVVVDVVTDGVSMVRNYRNQFRRIIRRDGWSGLIDRMQSRLREGSEV